jgi:SOS response regulatory protein OraA/RecX
MEISQKIIDYAIWYYLKYYPSPKKLERKLVEKFWPNSENGKKYWWINDEEIKYILEEKLKNIIQEEEVIQSKIRNYKNKWKSKLYIRQKLFIRLEDRELIEKFLEEAFIQWELDLVKDEYEKLLIKLKIDKENMSFDQKSKIIQKLLSKWFRYDDIKNLSI